MAIGLAAAVLAAAVRPLAQKGIDLVGSVFNGATEAGAEKIAAEIEKRTGIKVQDIADDRLTADEWAQLKDFELQNQELLLNELQEAEGRDIDRVRLLNEDRSDARALQKAAMAQDDWLTRNFIHIYAILLTAFTFAFVAWAAFGARFDIGADGTLSAAGQAQIRTVDTVLGFLLGVSLSAIIQFFFGSSKGSSDKSRMLEDLIRTAQVRER
ncbi:MAG: hypothetical protein KDA73_02400 [Rhodobacteraceae bacterium]|nr:hypothetical protein [Paracoccaceae bacterium]